MIKYVNHDIVFSEFPDEITLAVNLSLCPNGCPGCHSSYLQNDIGEELTPERLLALLDNYRDEVTCVGLMGGDNDPRTVMALLESVRQAYKTDLKTGWYSGREKLPECFCPEVVDYVKLGPYRAQSGPLNQRTTNQRLYRIIRETHAMEDITSRFWR